MLRLWREGRNAHVASDCNPLPPQMTATCCQSGEVERVNGGCKAGRRRGAQPFSACPCSGPLDSGFTHTVQENRTPKISNLHSHFQPVPAVGPAELGDLPKLFAEDFAGGLVEETLTVHDAGDAVIDRIAGLGWAGTLILASRIQAKNPA